MHFLVSSVWTYQFRSPQVGAVSSQLSVAVWISWLSIVCKGYKTSSFCRKALSRGAQFPRASTSALSPEEDKASVIHWLSFRSHLKISWTKLHHCTNMEISNRTLTPPGASTPDTYLHTEEAHTLDWLTSVTSEEAQHKDQSLIESLCRQTSVVPFTSSCYGAAIQFSRVFNTVISGVGITLNIMTFLALNKMKLNKESLFMMKCLSLYDSLYLFTTMCLSAPVYILWVAGFGYIENTKFYYVYHIMLCLYRISMAVAFWLVCLLTAHRYEVFLQFPQELFVVVTITYLFLLSPLIFQVCKTEICPQRWWRQRKDDKSCCCGSEPDSDWSGSVLLRGVQGKWCSNKKSPSHDKITERNTTHWS